MHTKILYDSAYGNTAKVAETLSSCFAAHGSAEVMMIKDPKAEQLDGIDLLVLGSPTQGGRPTETMQNFIKNLPDLGGQPVAVFDTRFDIKTQKPGLRLVMRVIGYAARKMQAQLQRKRVRVLGAEGFIVGDTKGPLTPGEIDRVKEWASSLATTVKGDT